jgi:hypothetical protein
VVEIGVLEEDYFSELSSLSPTFAIPKKNGTIKVGTGFKKLNLLLKLHPFYIPNIGNTDMIRSTKGFNFATALC